MSARPSPQQLAWHDRELGMFVHFGLYTFRERKNWNQPGDPSIFDPARLDAGQWVDVARSLGARYIVLTAKHADGFCLWRTETTDFGVESSPWKGGRGDVVAELSRACADADMPLGIYLSPADAHFGAGVGGRAVDPTNQPAYDRVYRKQLTELLSRYGDVCEVWFDGSCVTEVGDILEDLAPDAMVFQGAHGTIRWVGNEAGYAPYPAWNGVRGENGRTGVATAAHGDPDGDMWLPLEVDTTIRDHYWMWERDTEGSLKSLEELMDVYYRSVGHGAVLLLNSNPDTYGLIPEADALRASELGAEIRRRFGAPLATTAGSATELLLNLGGPAAVDHVVIMEEISGGESVRGYVVEGHRDGGWQVLASGTAIGHGKIDFFPAAEVDKVRLRVTGSAHRPVFRKFAAFFCGVLPRFDRNRLVIHDPFLVGKWGAEIGSDWTTLDIDLRSACREARQYVLELEPFEGEVEVGTVELFQGGVKTEGFVSSAGNPRRRGLNVTAADAGYSLEVSLRRKGSVPTSGKISIIQAM